MHKNIDYSLDSKTFYYSNLWIKSCSNIKMVINRVLNNPKNSSWKRALLHSPYGMCKIFSYQNPWIWIIVKLRKTMLDSIMKKKPLPKLSPQRLGFLMVMVVSVWGMYLLSATKFRNDLKESDYLKGEIIKLSRQYLDALAKEKVSSNIGKFFSYIFLRCFSLC